MLSYCDAGVDVEAGQRLVKRIQAMVPGIGGFSGLYPLGDKYLVAGTDGVGTKLKLAFELNQHDTVGIDLVAMCANDVLVTGASLLFFMDYFASSKLDVDQAEQVIKGIVEGCRQASCVLLGGETAELPGFYQEGEYDLCGFALGEVAKDKLIDGSTIQEGDAIMGLPSSGLHSNGYSLARRVLEDKDLSLDYVPESWTESLGEVLMQPTVIYANQVHALKDEIEIKGMAHITGGGFEENIPRVIPDDLSACLDRSSWTRPKIFDFLQETGEIDTEEMYRTFNMGIGMVLVVNEHDACKVLDLCPGARQIGKVIKGRGLTWM